MTAPLTKADATALWHAVEDMKLNVSVMKDIPDLVEHIPDATVRLQAAQVALRKVQALVRDNRRARRVAQLVLDINAKRAP